MGRLYCSTDHLVLGARRRESLKEVKVLAIVPDQRA